ncbi:MAG: mannose-6-phosphate isomerase, class I [Propionibacteriaceae bacterium]|nr:mannose-6-phosphate isomerase, class I [Propionibacteriaceae bacterium]
MQPLTGVVKDYAWGSPTAIPNLLGRPSDGSVQAEYWLGTHAQGPAVLDAEHTTLDAWLRTHPDELGEATRERFGDRLPFLLKVLAADAPLSLQVHPTAEDAAAGFERENAAGIPLDAPERSFRDASSKPELLVALSPFEALSGFRNPTRTLELFEGLGAPADMLNLVVGPLRHRANHEVALAETFLDCLTPADERGDILVEVVAAAARHMDDPGEVGRFARLAVLLDEHYPGDPSLLAALLLNHVTLYPGDGLYTAPGTLHAYLSGMGIEIMANSDNVLRGGLTPKHIDPAALASCVNFEAIAAPLVTPIADGDAIWHYPTPDPQFQLWRVEPALALPVRLPGFERARILLVVQGDVEARTFDGATLRLTQGQACFIGADESVQLAGAALAFVASSGV